jgi:hypothetical protein
MLALQVNKAQESREEFVNTMQQKTFKAISVRHEGEQMKHRSMLRRLVPALVGAFFLGLPTLAQAAAERVCVVGIVAVADNPCTPDIESLLVDGELVTTTCTTTNPNGSIHQTVQSRFRGTITESTSQGDVVYRVTGQSHFHAYDSNGAPVITTIIDDLQAITPGPAPNFIIHSNIQFVVSATGDTAVQSFNQTATCKGNP